MCDWKPHNIDLNEERGGVLQLPFFITFFGKDKEFPRCSDSEVGILKKNEAIA